MTLTQRDLGEIEDLVKKSVKEEINYLPTKDEFYGKMNEVVVELKGMREDFALVKNRVYESHEPRILKLRRNFESILQFKKPFPMQALIIC